MDSFKLKNQRVKHILPIGHSQGNLTVVSEVYSVRKSTLSTQRCVDCLCKCGNTAQVSVSRLASGKAKSNVVPCCFICNKMKGVLSEGEFMEHLNKIFTRVG